MTPKLLIDGDLFAFQAVTNCIVEERVNEEEWTYSVNVKDAAADFDARVTEWQDKFRTKSVLIALGGLSYFRRKIMPLYKRNRDGKKKPLGYLATVAEIKAKWPWMQIDSLEADDVVGLSHSGNTVAISDDKDFRQLPGWLYVPRTGEDVMISDWSADEFHMTQTLTGDQADGYPGCPGVGPVSAKKILAGCKSRKEMWAAVVACFADHGFKKSDAICNARVARILRPGEYSKAKLKLWEPWT